MREYCEIHQKNMEPKKIQGTSHPIITEASNIRISLKRALPHYKAFTRVHCNKEGKKDKRAK